VKARGLGKVCQRDCPLTAGSPSLHSVNTPSGARIGVALTRVAIRAWEIELASKVFELSQTLRQQWLTADYDAKRRILDIVCLNCSLDGATLIAEMRKPFDVLAEGLLTKDSRDDRRWTFPNDFSVVQLMHSALAQVHKFTADEFYSLASRCE
jgi:hypothetical protein